MISDELIKETLRSSKIIAMVGASVPKENEVVAKARLKPSIIVMKYLLEFGYKVIPVNPFSAGKKVNGETIVEKLEDISSQIDIVNVFRPSKETPDIAKNAIKIGAKTLWLQFGIQNEEAEKISKSAGLNCIMNKCIKQEYQRLFLKMKPVFPVLLND
jgi:predicted CoA-binding protein